KGLVETIPHDNDGLHPSLGYFALSVLIFPNRMKPTASNYPIVPACRKQGQILVAPSNPAIGSTRGHSRFDLVGVFSPLKYFLRALSVLCGKKSNPICALRKTLATIAVKFYGMFVGIQTLANPASGEAG
ncbi:hypothetical protein M3O96_21440, partial [Aquiflexum sp. TKW24L]|uniref:hypothetical protein n=1 Tax=Aquiflexum sp. TKW24L TaxID=2942212 RepID=UPI0020C16E51